MASTVVASRNESSWGKSLESFMGKKLTYPNSHQNPNNTSNNSLAVNSKQSKSKPTKKKKYLSDTSAVVVNQSAAASDDAYSFNQRTNDTKAICFDQFSHCRYVEISVSASSRSELVELKRKLETELDRVRNISNRIESGHFGNYSARSKDKEKCNNDKKVWGSKRQLPVGSVGPRGPVRQGLDLYWGNGSGSEELMKMCKQILMKMMKHKHSWVFNKPVDAVALGLHDYHQIVKRPMDLWTVKMNLGKGVYGSPSDFAADVRLTFNNALLYNPKTDEVHLMAAQMLSQFEDLFRPVQEKLERSFGREVEVEENVGLCSGGDDDDDEVQGSSWNEVVAASGPPAIVVERPKKPKTNLNGSFGKERELKKAKTSDVMGSFSKEKEVERVVEVLQQPVQQSKFQPSASATNVVNSDFVSPVPAVVPPVRAPPATERPRSVKDGAVKSLKQPRQPKPRAKDPNKREMSMEEKQKLGNGLQNLPQEKMPQLVHIIRKRNLQLSAESDEIELDIEALDTETLWELDRFVTNWKKLESKTKREALMGITSAAPSSTRPTTDTSDTDEAVVVSDKNEVGKKMKNREDDIDIGDEMPESSFPPVEIEKDDGVHVHDIGNKNGNGNGNASSSVSSSGSSSSDSSSSSGSDSGSSSGSDSDADEAHS